MRNYFILQNNRLLYERRWNTSLLIPHLGHGVGAINRFHGQQRTHSVPTPTLDHLLWQHMEGRAPCAWGTHTPSCRAGRREQFFLLFFGNFHAALFLSEDWWDLFMAPPLISELICDAVIGSAATRGSTVAIPPHAGALPAATEQPLRPGPGALLWD